MVTLEQRWGNNAAAAAAAAAVVVVVVVVDSRQCLVGVGQSINEPISRVAGKSNETAVTSRLGLGNNYAEPVVSAASAVMMDVGLVAAEMVGTVYASLMSRRNTSEEMTRWCS